jgi:hypothetical protein
VGVEVGVSARVGFGVAVRVGVAVLLGDSVCVGVAVGFGVGVRVGVWVGVGVGCGVSVRVGIGVAVGKVCVPPTATLMVLLHVEPGFFTHQDAVEAGPWYPLATSVVGETETVVSWMPL